MTHSSVHPPASITQLGLVAGECVIPGTHGKVLAAFSQALYLLTETGDLFWVTNAGFPMHRRAAVTALLPRPAAGSTFQVGNHQLTIEPCFELDFQSARIWQEPAIEPIHILETSGLPHRIHSFLRGLDLTEVKGFGIFIPTILSYSRKDSMDLLLSPTDPIIRQAQPLVLGLMRICAGGQSSKNALYANGLIGLGAGLTPSGDDFLGGLLFAINSLRDAYPDVSLANLEISIDSFRTRTNLISFTLLKDLSEGHGLAPLHEIVHGLLCGVDQARMQPSVQQLTRVGHSTGWDVLTGLLTGLLVSYRLAHPLPLPKRVKVAK